MNNNVWLTKINKLVIQFVILVLPIFVITKSDVVNAEVQKNSPTQQASTANMDEEAQAKDDSNFFILDIIGNQINVFQPVVPPITKSELFIDGKKQKVDVINTREFEVNSKIIGTTAYARIQLPWGLVTTEAVGLKEGQNALVYNPVTRELEDTVVKTIRGYAKEWAAAYQSGNPDSFKSVTPEFKNQVATDLERMKRENLQWSGRLVESVFDMESLRVDKVNGNWHAYVNTNLRYHSDLHKKGEIPDQKEGDNFAEYTLVYDPQTRLWKVKEQNATFGIDNKKIKQFDEN